MSIVDLKIINNSASSSNFAVDKTLTKKPTLSPNATFDLADYIITSWICDGLGSHNY
ncbi:hypothetical protein SCB49_12749 [unidentified eubacterium SCB49]|nr:hypothetical protein SCB49_12749 [unidentified eubacterium SCB49]